MAITSNLITDHLEQMSPSYIRTALFQVGASCITLGKDSNVVKTGSHCNLISEEELREDIAALGLNLKDNERYYFRYDFDGPVGQESVYLSMRMFNESGIIFQVDLITQPDQLVQDLLEDINPLSASEYAEYTYYIPRKGRENRL